MSWNVWQWNMSTQQMEDTLKHYNIEIAALQESWNGTRNNEMAQIMNWDVRFGGKDSLGNVTNRDSWSIGHYHMPQVIMSKWNIIEHQYYNIWYGELPHQYPDEIIQIARGATLALVEISPEMKVYIMAIHGVPWGGPEDTEKEMKQLFTVIDTLPDMPVIILGDYNSTSARDIDHKGDTLAISFLESKGYFDSYRTIHPDPQTHPGKTNDDGRIDFIFANHHFLADTSYILDDNRLVDSNIPKISDHLAVVSKLTFVVEGCTDSTASNFDSNANKDDGSCVIIESVIDNRKMIKMKTTYLNNQLSIKLSIKKSVKFNLVNLKGNIVKQFFTDGNGNAILNLQLTGIYFLERSNSTSNTRYKILLQQ